MWGKFEPALGYVCMSLKFCVFAPVCLRLSIYRLWKHTGFYTICVGVEYVCSQTMQDLEMKMFNTAKHALLHTTDIKVLLYMKKKQKNCRSTDVGERSEDVIEWFGSEQTLLVFVYVTLNKKQT